MKNRKPNGAPDQPIKGRRPIIAKGAGMPKRFLSATSRPASRPFARARAGADTTLDKFNERQEDRVLHPTKGWRKVSVKRSRAQILVAAILNGQRMSSRQMGDFMRHG